MHAPRQGEPRGWRYSYTDRQAATIIRARSAMALLLTYASESSRAWKTEHDPIEAKERVRVRVRGGGGSSLAARVSSSSSSTAAGHTTGRWLRLLCLRRPRLPPTRHHPAISRLWKHA